MVAFMVFNIDKNQMIIIALLLVSCSAPSDPTCLPGSRTSCECGYAGFQQYGVSVCGAYNWGQCYCEPLDTDGGADSH